MSVTVTDILGFPCMQGARVAAGAGGLGKVVTSVTVLEYAQPTPLLNELYENNEFYGGELVITAFAGVADSVSLQCDNLRRLAAAGEVGLILYYVGILLPAVAPELVELADALDFVLIVMPERRLDLRYSEVICEVMEAVVRDRDNAASLSSDVLTQMVRLREHQRTVDSVLRMVRDQTHASLLLTDGTGHVLGQAAWPLSMELRLERLPAAPMTALPGGRTVWRCPLDSGELYLIKDGTPLRRETVSQAADVVRLAVNLWGGRQAGAQMSELVRAILRDEPMKMRRLAELFHIPVEEMHAMWVLRCPDGQQRLRALTCLREGLEPQCRTVVADCCEDCAVAFLAWPGRGADAGRLAQDVLEQLGVPEATITRCHQLRDTAAVRQAFLLHQEHWRDARCIWPKRQSYTYQDLCYAADCRRVVEAGETALHAASGLLDPLRGEKEGEGLMGTLCCCLLDAAGRAAVCAELLHVHKNTIKYRLERISLLLSLDLRSEPERFYLYRAAALERLLAQAR